MTINEWSDVTAMAEAVQNKMVSPRELVKDTISEAQRTNTKINAIVSQRYEKALVEAENRDFSDKPFSGVPIFLKDLGQEQAGEPSTAGSRLFTSYHAKETDNYCLLYTSVDIWKHQQPISSFMEVKINDIR